MSTKIEWTHPPGYKGSTWNTTIGCSKVSAGCRECYAETMAKRLKAMGNPYYKEVIGEEGRWNGKIVYNAQALSRPLHWRSPRCVFVDSMSDLFHKNVEHIHLYQVFEMMAMTPQHRYLILTKRPDRMRLNSIGSSILPNVGLGVSVEDQASADERIPFLQDTRAAMPFISYEPALGPVNWDGLLDGIDWLICGGESGPGARDFQSEWATDTRAACEAAGVAFFAKQYGRHPYFPKNPTPYQPPHPMRLKNKKGADQSEWPIEMRGAQAWPAEFFAHKVTV